MKDIDLITINSKYCYLNYINYLSWFHKRKIFFVIKNHENIFFTVYTIKIRKIFK